MDASVLDKLHIKFFHTPAAAVVTNDHVPAVAIHSVVLASTGIVLWIGEAHPDCKVEVAKARTSGSGVEGELAAMQTGSPEENGPAAMPAPSSGRKVELVPARLRAKRSR